MESTSCCSTEQKYFVLLKNPLQFKKLPTCTAEGILLLSDRLFKKFDLWLSLHCWSLTFHVVSVQHTFFFFHANFLVKTTNRHLIKGQPYFISRLIKKFLFHLRLSGQFEKVLPDREITDAFLPGPL